MKRKTISLFGVLLALLLSWQAVYSISHEGLLQIDASDDQLAEKINIFPNPTDGQFKISMEISDSEHIIAKVYDITGKLIKDVSRDLVHADSKVTADVNLDHPRSGIYFLRVEIGTKTATRKIIVK
jgi:hypothetical protein